MGRRTVGPGGGGAQARESSAHRIVNARELLRRRAAPSLTRIGRFTTLEAFQTPSAEHPMKGNSEVVQHLNKLLANEQSAFHQYLLHSQLLKSWGVEKLAKTERDEAMEEVGHAELLIERILYLAGTPKMDGGEPAQASADVRETLQRDLALEVGGIADLREGIATAERTGDSVSRELMVKILTDEEQHEDHLATQLELIDKIGIENYIAAHL
jgi:bacterioferritin